jgi:hypothetical protein
MGDPAAALDDLALLVAYGFRVASGGSLRVTSGTTPSCP